MKLSNWIRFTWDLTRLPLFENTLPEHYEIGPATAEDEKELRKMEKQLDKVQATLRAVRTSASFRAGRVATMPLRRLRRLGR